MFLWELIQQAAFNSLKKALSLEKVLLSKKYPGGITLTTTKLTCYAVLKVISHVGIPEQLVNENGPPFSSSDFADLNKRLKFSSCAVFNSNRNRIEQRIALLKHFRIQWRHLVPIIYTLPNVHKIPFFAIVLRSKQQQNLNQLSYFNCVINGRNSIWIIVIFNQQLDLIKSKTNCVTIHAVTHASSLKGIGCFY